MKQRAAFLLPPSLLVTISLASSTLLVPTDREMALIQYKAKEFEDARERFRALVARGDYSVGVVKPLSELHVQFGDVEEAAALLERFVEARPTDVAARRKLGLYYQYAQQPGNYRANLETLAKLELSESALRELSQIYNAEGRFEEQIEILRVLTESFPIRRQDFLDLAYLEAQSGRPADAIEALSRLARSLPESMDDEIVELQLNLMLDTGRAGDALDAARAFLEKELDVEALTRFAALLEYKGEVARAERLALTFDNAAETHPPLLAQLSHLQAVNGHADAAFERLRRIEEDGGVPDAARPVFVELALARGERDLAFRALEGRDLDTLPEWLIQGLADRVVADREATLAQGLLARLRPGFLAAHPILSAELAGAAGMEGAARAWLDRVQTGALAPLDQRRLAYAHERFGDAHRALALLESLEQRGVLPVTDLGSLARLYVELEESHRGTRVLSPYRTDPRFELSSAWALVAADSGESEAVVAWMQRNRDRALGPQLLHDLFFIGERRGDAAIALAAAERGVAEAPASRIDRLYLSRALSASGRVGEALELARLLLPGDCEEEQGYIDALHAAWRQGLPVSEELSVYLAARVDDSTVDPAERRALLEQWVALRDYDQVLDKLAELTQTEPDRWIDLYVETATRAGALTSALPVLEELLQRGALSAPGREIALGSLVDAGRDEAALPHLRELARTVGQHWVYLYDRALEHTDRTDERVALWIGRARRTDLTPDESRAVAYSLIELGEESRATELFFALAEEAEPESPDVAEYVYLAMNAQVDDAVDWLAERGASSVGATRAAWMRHLLRANAPARAAELARETPLETMDPSVRDAYAEALSAARSKVELARVLEWSASRESDPGRLRRFARLAFEADALPTADTILERLIALAPGDPDAVRQLGLVAFMRGDYERSRAMLGKYLDSGASDYEVHYYYAETALRDGRGATARHHFERSLAHIEATAAASFQERATRAQILHRLDRPREAFQTFEELLSEDPNNTHLRADYVAARLERNDYEAAELALASFDHKRLDSGTLRLLLLQANLWIRTDRAREAEDMLRNLDRERPGNPSVVAALASATASGGRWVDALGQYDRALQLAPADENVRDARSALWRQHGPRAGGEWLDRSVGDDQSQQIVSFAARTRLTDALEMGMTFRRTEARLSLPGPDAVPSSISGRLDYGEVHLQHDLRSGLSYRGALHVLRRRPGAGLTVGKSSYGRSTSVTAELQVPFWDIVGGVLDDARRDRLRIDHREELTRNLQVSGALAVQRYGSALGDGLSSSRALTANLSYATRLDDTLVSLSYVFDGEYFRAGDASSTLPGERSSALFLSSREVHAPGLFVTSRLSKRFRPGGFAGYSWDRLGGAAPFFGVHAEYELPNGFYGRASFERRLYRLDTARAENGFRATFHWSF